ncbi:MAG TPA: ABC transporter ATP-binding protein [Trebonia sp.]|nr:ABC transporter ATP-binding protein [Trebonia sp.]
MSASPVAALWRLHPYLRPYRYRLALLLLAAIVSTGTEIVIPLIAKVVIDGAIAHHERSLLLPLGLLAIGLGAAGAALSLVRRWGVGNAVAGMEQAIRDDLYQHLQRLDPAFHDEWQSGQLLSRATTDLSSIRRFAGFGLVFIFISIMTFAAVTGLLISLNWWLGLTTAALFAPVLVFCTRFERRYKILARRSQDQDGDLTTLVEEASTGVRVLKSLGRRPEASRAHLAQAAELGKTRIEMAVVDGIFWSTLNLVPNAAIAISVVLGALAISHHSLSIGGLVAFITLALQLVWPVEALGYILASGEEAATAAQRVLEIFDTAPTIGDEPPTAARSVTSSTVATERVRLTAGAEPGSVRYEHVRFSYPGATAPVLRDVNLHVAPGETLVLAGATGAGKTTLLHLVPRLADATGGRVLVSGTDVRDIPLAVLRAAVGCAFEEATLFSASVLENVTFGAASATEDEVEAALTAAQARFAYDLPWGLDTRIGEQGMALSGGQRQRVALARAILARPQVLILDDPLSALDVHTEERVTRALGEILAGVTAIVVAHRPSTVALADRVALLDGGVIAATGSHRELMANEPIYANLMTMEEVHS